MAKKLLLISHGYFCEELKKSTEMIMGPQENIDSLPLLPEESPDDFRRKFEEKVTELGDVIVLADLMGGTPCNVASRLVMEGAQFDLYAGMNMPMVIGFLNGVLLDEEVDLVSFGATNIYHVNSLISTLEDEDE
ncbi:PTS sugar transporter subunit IIA [Streptococcus gallinaceus]|uniref:PTS system mannose-specific IIA component n=1 Tax=Streptococcus gallinaceus TaxID=165758 RepID=A0ABV2JJD6_9STRE|nr:PTS sugar transporter subunit IIA [Streptococcus gallinaceus]MCP1639010.1 PTS system mannose-specific IIA component [Streptococcus gallinaceus]MCP1769746.1 PTS system mannose-specific IIA component [Streptococcus gallinaceus]